MSAVWRSAEGEAQIKTLYRGFLDRWPVPRAEHRLQTGQGETFVVESGPADGPALVLLHGSAFNSVTWMGDIAAWARHFRVFAVDLIGEPGFSAPSRPDLDSAAHAEWLDEVLDGLGLETAAFAGLSLGGWMALDYATRRPGRVTRLVLIAPGGIGRNRNILLWALPLLMLGSWGRRKLVAKIGIEQPRDPSPAQRSVAEMHKAIFANFRARRTPLPIAGDAALARLTMPVLAILGGRDVFIDSAGARDRLKRHVPHAHIVWLEDAPHAILGQTALIGDFLANGQPHTTIVPPA